MLARDYRYLRAHAEALVEAVVDKYARVAV